MPQNKINSLPILNQESYWAASLIYGIGDILTKSTRLLLIPFYVQMLTTTELGVLAICQAISTGSWALLGLGTGPFVQRFIQSTQQVSRDKTITENTFVSTIWWFRLVAGVLLTGCLLGIVYVMSQSPFEGLPFLLVAMALFTGNWRAGISVTESGLIGEGRALSYRLLTFLVFLTSFILIITLVAYFEMGIWGAVIGEFTALGIWMFATGIRHTWVALPDLKSVNWKSFFNFSFPIVPHVIFMWGLMSADRLILSGMVDKSEIGVYDIAYLLGSGIAIFGTALLLPWLPTFYRQTDKASAANFFTERALSQIVICLAIALSVNLFALELAKLMTASYALKVVPLIQLILPATFLLTVNAIFEKPLVHQKKTAKISMLSGSAFALNLILNFLLDPILGVYGAAIATVIAYAFLAVACILLSNRYLEIKWNLRTRDIAHVSMIAAVIFLAGLLFPLEVSPFWISTKLLLTGLCWIALFVRFGNSASNFRPTLCLSPLKP